MDCDFHISDIIVLLEKIKSQEVKLEDSVHNVFILNLEYQDHAICCALVIDKSCFLSESLVHLFIFNLYYEENLESYQ